MRFYQRKYIVLIYILPDYSFNKAKPGRLSIVKLNFRAAIKLKEVVNCQLKNVRAQKFPRTDFFKTLTAGRK